MALYNNKTEIIILNLQRIEFLIFNYISWSQSFLISIISINSNEVSFNIIKSVLSIKHTDSGFIHNKVPYCYYSSVIERDIFRIYNFIKLGICLLISLFNSLKIEIFKEKIFRYKLHHHIYAIIAHNISYFQICNTNLQTRVHKLQIIIICL